jgi:RES domain
VPRQAPPTNYSGTIPLTGLPGGTILSRVHDAAYPLTSFNPVASDPLFGGGRFDATPADPYTYLYAADLDDGAVAEALLRDIDANDRGARFLAKKYWRGRALSRVVLNQDVTLVELRSGKQLGAIGQDTWLTTCDSDDYPQTRAWAHWLRREARTAQGIAWKSKREPTAVALVLFGDQCPTDLLSEAAGPLAPDPCTFDSTAGFEWLRVTLAEYRVSIRN